MTKKHKNDQFTAIYRKKDFYNRWWSKYKYHSVYAVSRNEADKIEMIFFSF